MSPPLAFNQDSATSFVTSHSSTNNFQSSSLIITGAGAESVPGFVFVELLLEEDADNEDNAACVLCASAAFDFSST